MNSINPKTEPAQRRSNSSDVPLTSPHPPSITSAHNSIQPHYHKTPWWKIVLEIGTFIAALGAFISAAIYAYITNQQLHAMKRTYEQIQMQSTLMRQQLAGTEGATVVLNNKSVGGALFAQPETLAQNFHITIPFANDGIVPAHQTETNLTIRLLRFSDNTPIKSLGTCTLAIPIIAHGEHVYRQCFIEGLEQRTLKAIAANQQTLAIDGDYTYEDGFENRYKIPMCFRYLSKAAGVASSQTTGDNRFEDCDSFTIMRDAMLKSH